MIHEPKARNFAGTGIAEPQAMMRHLIIVAIVSLIFAPIFAHAGAAPGARGRSTGKQELKKEKVLVRVRTATRAVKDKSRRLGARVSSTLRLRRQGAATRTNKQSPRALRDMIQRVMRRSPDAIFAVGESGNIQIMKGVSAASSRELRNILSVVSTVRTVRAGRSSWRQRRATKTLELKKLTSVIGDWSANNSSAITHAQSELALSASNPWTMYIRAAESGARNRGPAIGFKIEVQRALTNARIVTERISALESLQKAVPELKKIGVDAKVLADIAQHSVSAMRAKHRRQVNELETAIQKAENGPMGELIRSGAAEREFRQWAGIF